MGERVSTVIGTALVVGYKHNCFEACLGSKEREVTILGNIVHCRIGSGSQFAALFCEREADAQLM
jgi:hypothetical protein